MRVNSNKIKVILIAVVLVLITLLACLYWQSAITVNADVIVKNNIEFKEFTVNGSKSKKFSSVNGGEMKIEFNEPVSINRVVLKEKSSSIDSIKIIANNREIYVSDFVGDFKYCAFKSVSTNEITIIFTASGDFSIKDIRIFAVGEKSNYTQRVISEFNSETENNASAVIVKDIVSINKFGDVIVNTERLNAINDLNKNFNMIMDVSISVGDNESEQDIFQKCWKNAQFRVVSELAATLNRYNFNGYNFSFDFKNSIRKDSYSKFLIALKQALPYNIVSVSTDISDLQFSEKALVAVSSFNMRKSNVEITKESDVFKNVYDQYETLLAWGLERRLSNVCVTVDGYDMLSAQGQRDIKAFVADFLMRGMVLN